MLTDPAFRTGASVDKRGGKGKGAARLARKARPDATSPDAGEADAGAAERWARARGLAGPSSSSSEPSSASDSDSDSGAGAPAATSDLDSGPDDATLAAEYGVGALAANPDERVPTAESATPRLALVDLDWDRTRAVDVLAVLRSFAPASGRVERVRVYPSDYGLARMADEDARGPAPLRAAAVAAAADRAAGREAKHGGDSDDDAPGPSSSSSDGGEPDAARLRAYERSRLRYYYAIVDCDTAATAERVAAECDGSEFLRTGATIDCRFVADGDDFSARTVRDVATVVPADYAPPDEVPLATQFTKPTTGWDADDGGRRRALARAAAKATSADALRDDDFRAYLGSDDSSSGGEDGGEGDGAAAAARYRALLAGASPDTARAGGKDWAAGGAPPKRGGDLSVTFAGGLDALSARLAAKKEASSSTKGSRTVWDNYLAARADKRAARKAAARGGGSSDDDADGAGVPAAPPRATGAEDPFDDPFFADDGADVGAAAAVGESGGEEEKKGGKAARKAARKGAPAPPATAADAADTARLELLAMDDAALRAGAVVVAADGDAAAPAQPPLKPTRKARARARAAVKAAGRADSDDDGAPGFEADLGDSRFAGLLSDPAFALDPTDPAAKRGGDLAARVTAAKKQRVQAAREGGEAGAAPAPVPAGAAALVASLKRKAAAAGGRSGSRRAPANED
jgi:hypothetical protein